MSPLSYGHLYFVKVVYFLKKLFQSTNTPVALIVLLNPHEIATHPCLTEEKTSTKQLYDLLCVFNILGMTRPGLF